MVASEALLSEAGQSHPCALYLVLSPLSTLLPLSLESSGMRCLEVGQSHPRLSKLTAFLGQSHPEQLKFSSGTNEDIAQGNDSRYKSSCLISRQAFVGSTALAIAFS